LFNAKYAIFLVSFAWKKNVTRYTLLLKEKWSVPIMIKMFVYKLKINIKCSILILYVPWCKWFYGVPIQNLAFMFHKECNSSLYFRSNIQYTFLVVMHILGSIKFVVFEKKICYPYSHAKQCIVMTTVFFSDWHKRHTMYVVYMTMKSMDISIRHPRFYALYFI